MNYSLFSNIAGHETIKKILISGIVKKKIPNLWLFSGDRGLGKKSLALEYAANLLNTSVKQLENHPDYYELSNIDNKQISVDEARKLQNFASKSASIGTGRVVIIDSIDLLTINASNSILKILEEPGKNLVFIVIYHKEKKILDTIKSRGIELQFYNLAKNEVTEYLQNNFPKIVRLSEIEREILVNYGRNNLGNIIRLYEQNFLEFYQELQKSLSSVIKGDYQALFRFIESNKFSFEWFYLILSYNINRLVKDDIDEGLLLSNFSNVDKINLLYLWDEINRLYFKVKYQYLPKDKISLIIINKLMEAIKDEKILYNNTYLLR